MESPWNWETEGDTCVELLRDLIRIPSVNRGTGETSGAHANRTPRSAATAFATSNPGGSTTSLPSRESSNADSNEVTMLARATSSI